LLCINIKKLETPEFSMRRLLMGIHGFENYSPYLSRMVFCRSAAWGEPCEQRAWLCNEWSTGERGSPAEAVTLTFAFWVGSLLLNFWSHKESYFSAPFNWFFVTKLFKLHTQFKPIFSDIQSLRLSSLFWFYMGRLQL
jgi:hypothetical protein